MLALILLHLSSTCAIPVSATMDAQIAQFTGEDALAGPGNRGLY